MRIAQPSVVKLHHFSVSRDKNFKKIFKKIFKKLKNKKFFILPNSIHNKKDRASPSKLCLNLYSIHLIFQSIQSLLSNNLLNCLSSIPSIIVLTNSPKSFCPSSPVNLISPCHFPIISPTLTLPPLQAFLTSCLFHS